MTNKKCDFYYLVAPSGTVKEPVNAIQVMNGAINPNGGVSGKYTVTSGYVEFPVLIEGLERKENMISSISLRYTA